MIWAIALPLVFMYILFTFWFKRQPVFQRGGQPGRMIPPIRQTLENPDNIGYGVRNFQTPKVTGVLFKLLVRLSYSRFGRYIMVPPMIQKSNLDCMRGVYMPEKPTFHGVGSTPPPTEDQSIPNKELLQKLLEKEIEGEGGFHLPTVADLSLIHI